MRIKKFLILFLIGLFLASPLVGLAQFKLQQTYPSVGGSQLSQDVAASKSIPSLVKYLFNLAVWICILVAILVLIAGGIQYVTSSGDVSKMSGAKTRIYSSLLGLTILIGAWFVLHTMNPSLVIPKISYIPIKQGIVFFTKDGYDRFKAADDASIINDLVQANQAKFISYSSPDLTLSTAFGPLIFSNCGVATGNKVEGQANNFPKISIVAHDNNSLNFADFQPYTFAFWGKKAQGAKLTFYDQTNQTETTGFNSFSYDYRGLLKPDGNPIEDIKTIERNSKIQDAIVIKPAYFATLNSDTEQNVGVIQEDISDLYPKRISFYTKTSVQYLNASNYFKVATTDDEDRLNKPLVANAFVNFSQCGKDDGIYFNLITDTAFRNVAINTSAVVVKHPPLSVRITWSNAGVYLVDANLDERYFDASARDFKDPSINFDQKATSIKIINDIPARTYTDEDGVSHTTPAESYDFLAILHQDDNFSGRLKVYFEQRMYANNGSIKSSKTSDKALIPAYDNCGMPIDPTKIINSDTETVKKYKLFYVGTEVTQDGVKLYDILFKDATYGKSFWKDYNFGHLPMVLFTPQGGIVPFPNGDPTIDKDEIIIENPPGGSNYSGYQVKEEARYGELDKAPASVEVFELSQNSGGFGECQEVKLCTEKGGLGYCLTYTSEQNKTDEANLVYYPMPWYLKVPLPFENSIFGVPAEKKCFEASLPKFKKSDGTDKFVEIANNIKSITIKPEGKCAVVLIGGMKNVEWYHAVLDPTYLFTARAAKNKSEVFTSSDYNLDDNQIGQCGSSVGFGRWLNKSCADAIAVYPIK